MNSLDTLFGPPHSKRHQKEQAQTIKGWARELLAPAPDTVIMVTEKDCRDPKCPGIETVIALVDKGRVQRVNISKPMIDVIRADVLAAIEAGSVSVTTYPATTSST